MGKFLSRIGGGSTKKKKKKKKNHGMGREETFSTSKKEEIPQESEVFVQEGKAPDRSPGGGRKKNPQKSLELNERGVIFPADRR